MVNGRLWSWWLSNWRWVIGPDVFVSYSREDGISYAEGLAAELTARGFACRVDLWQTTPDRTPPKSLERAIRASKLLVVVATEGAARSKYVLWEVTLFLPTQRMIVPVAFGTALPSSPWSESLAGLPIAIDPQSDALVTGKPAEQVISRIENATDFIRRAHRLRNLALLSGAVFLILLGLSTVFERRAQSAAVQAKRAVKDEASAEQARDSAIEATTRQTAEAERQRKLADAAKLDQQAAEAQTGKAEYQTRVGLGRAASLMAVAPGKERQAIELGLQSMEPGVRYKGTPPLEAVTGLTDATAAIWYSLPLEGSIKHVDSARFSRDGLSILATSEGHKIVWSAVSGKRLMLSLRESNRRFPEPAAGPDTKFRLQVSNDTATVVDAATGRTRFPLTGYKGRINHYTFSPQQELLVIGTNEGTLQAWDTSAGKALPLYKGHSTEPYFEKFLTLDQLQDPEQMTKMNGKIMMYPNIGINWIGFSPREPKMISAANDRTARIWNIDLDEPLETLGGHELAVNYADFSPNGDLAVTASEDGVVRLWTSEGRPLAELKGHNKPVRLVVFNADEARLATFSDDGTARLWRPMHDDALRTFDDVAGPLERVALSPDGRLLAASSQVDGFTRVWEVSSRKLIQRFSRQSAASEGPDVFDVRNLTAGDLASPSDHRVGGLGSSTFPQGQLNPFLNRAPNQSVTRYGHPVVDRLGNGADRGNSKYILDAGPVFFADGKRLLTQLDGHEVISWDTHSWQPVAHFTGHTDVLSAMAVSPDHTRVVSADNARNVFLWDARTGKTICRVSDDLVSSIIYSPDGKTFATSAFWGRVTLWDGRTGKQIRRFDDLRLKSIGSVQFSRDGRTLLLSSQQGSGYVWHLMEVSSGRIEHSVQGGGSDWAGFSPDGSRILSRSGKRAALWDGASGALIAPLEGHAYQIETAVFSPDGRYIATGSWDETLRLWDGVTGRAIATMRGHTGRVHGVTFSADGKSIATASMDGTARLYPGTLSSFLQRAHESMSAPFAAEYRGKYPTVSGQLSKRKP